MDYRILVRLVAYLVRKKVLTLDEVRDLVREEVSPSAAHFQDDVEDTLWGITG